ncbi:hypothetical protein B0H12DRAFT_1148357 [Mycena haematopus]|nr:hypothetical protein B0H12DRAFT_1148357 [Mycena haematopus]
MVRVWVEEVKRYAWTTAFLARPLFPRSAWRARSTRATSTPSVRHIVLFATREEPTSTLRLQVVSEASAFGGARRRARGGVEGGRSGRKNMAKSTRRRLVGEPAQVLVHFFLRLHAHLYTLPEPVQPFPSRLGCSRSPVRLETRD